MEQWNEKSAALWCAGTLTDAWRTLGAHCVEGGVHFAVWAPHARAVHVTGDFCSWDAGTALTWSEGGVWQGLVPGAGEGSLYKYIITAQSGEQLWKADPFALASQLRPDTASMVYCSRHRWQDDEWMTARRALSAPRNIYEVHPGSWRQHGDGSFLTWDELAEELIPYVLDMGYTHIELLPVAEHPLDASWGYQVTGFFAATARYGEPDGLKRFVERCHQKGIGVIFDWVPGHFCRDAHGLGRFDGQPLYEAGDHPSWGTYKFDFGRGEVRSFLMSSGLFWLTEYHADGLRVDGVSSMLYLNFALPEGAPRRYNSSGGDSDEGAIAFLRAFNTAVGREVPGAFTVAEESSAWALVTYPPEAGGLGFHYKWDMGWMNDTLRYMQTDFPERREKHQLLNFSMVYAFSENFILPLSHDEVVHGKRSLIGRMPGDWWRQFAGLRLLHLYTLCHPGAKLMFMGGEFGQFIEWREYEALEWFLLGYDTHRQCQAFMRAANHLYRREKALWEQDRGWEGFRWLAADAAAENLLAFRRMAADGESITCVLHFSPDELGPYRLGVPEEGAYEEILSSDDAAFGGSGRVNAAPIHSQPIPWQGEAHSIVIHVPPVGGTLIKKARE